MVFIDGHWIWDPFRIGDTARTPTPGETAKPCSRVKYPQIRKHLCYIVEKSSITVDGISPTVATLGEEWFEIAIIPHIWKVTILSVLARVRSYWHR